MADTTVYTIFAGILPTLGFDKKDFTTDRTGNVSRGKVRGSSLGIRGVIANDGSLKKARIRGSVAWYEYSTTVRAIHTEVLEERAPSALKMSNSNWSQMFGQGKSLHSSILQNMGIEDMAPTGESVTAGKGTPSEQVTEEMEGVEHPDDAELRKQGKLVGLSNAVDLYFKGKDGKIYRLDVTSMTMDDDRAHHGLTSYEDRLKKGVTSSQILDVLQGPDGVKNAEERLLTYFKESQEGWNSVIQRLKKRVHSTKSQASKFLSKLESGDGNITGNLKKLQDGLKGKKGDDVLSQIRPAKKEAIRRMRRDSSNRLGTGTKAQGFQSAVSFALHAIGNVVNTFAKDSAVQGGYSTEYRLGDAPANWTVEVKHQLYNSGAQVLEFMPLKQGDVILHNEAALQHVYMRDMFTVDKDAMAAQLDLLSIRQNQMANAQGLLHDNNAVEIGGVTSTVASGIARDGSAVYQRATAVISPQKFNKDIENWIQTTGVGHGFRDKVGKILKPHLQAGEQVSGYQQDTLTKFGDVAAKTAMTGRTGVYWGMAQYLAGKAKEQFDDSVNPKWWGAPYISLLYPSGQVGSATK